MKGEFLIKQIQERDATIASLRQEVETLQQWKDTANGFTDTVTRLAKDGEIVALRQEVEELREALGKSIDDIERERTTFVENWAGDPADLDEAYANHGSALLCCLIKEIRALLP